MKTIFKRLSVVLLVLIGMSWSATLMADNQWDHEKSDCFTAYKKSDGVYHFKLLVTRRANTTEPHGGNYVWSTGAMNADGTKKDCATILMACFDGYSGPIIEYCSAFTAVDATIDSNGKKHGFGRVEHLGYTWIHPIIGSIDLQNARLAADDSLVVLSGVDGPNNERAYFLEFDWYAPVEMAGTTPYLLMCYPVSTGNPMQNNNTYTWDAVQSSKAYTYPLTANSSDLPSIPSFTGHTVSIQDPIPAIDLGDGVAKPGQMLLMLTAQQDKVHSYRLPGETAYTPFEEVSYAPAIYIPISDQERRNYRIGTKLVYNGDKKQMTGVYKDFRPEYPILAWDYCNTYDTVTSNTVDIPAYHCIHDFQANMRALKETGLHDGAIELTWKIAYPLERDAMDGDMFEIQRDTFPDFHTAETIGAINYNAQPSADEIVDNHLIYTYVDESPEVKKGNNGTQWEYHYRIRRVSSAMWDWEDSKQASDLYYSKLAAKTYIQSNSYTFVRLAGFDKNAAIRINTTDQQYKQDRKIIVGASMPIQNTYYDGTPIYLVKKVISKLHNDTVVQEILIPQDSIRKENAAFWQLRYTDEASTPCVYYEYSLRIDTASSSLRYSEQDLYGLRLSYEEPCIYVSLSNRGYYSGGMTLDRDTTVSYASKTNPSSVFLKWGTKGGAFDYYTIRRRPVGETAWTTVDTNITDLYYDDHHSPVGRDLEYMIIGTEVCDSLVQDSMVLTGRRYEYGSIAGYVTMPNGLAYAGVNVTLQCDSVGYQMTTSTITDEKGHYKFDHLFYSESGITYTVFPTSTNSYDNFGQRLDVDLSGWSAEPENINFTNRNAVKFSGRVLYEHSTVPVYHCQFLVNGQLALNSDGKPYETDASGNFELMVPAGSTTVRGVMKGHTFLNDGYFLIEGDSVLPLTETTVGARLYDQTKVTVVGHVAGGTIQGSKEWGNQQAINNLGDNLTLVFELEGDNISHLVHYDDDRSEVDTTYAHPLSGQTAVKMTKKRVTVHPDSATGEYRVELFPVRWKLVQATAEGYSTLLPAGKTSEAINLVGRDTIADTLRLGGQTMLINRLYNIIYRAPITLTYQQLYYGMKVDYLGEPKLVYSGLNGLNPSDSTVNVYLSERDTTTGELKYLFDYPVFQSGQKYTYIINAHEDYYYNNNPSNPNHEKVMLKDIDVRVINGMNKSNDVQTVHLHDVTGDGRVTLLVNNPTFTLQGTEALRRIEMETEVDGLYVQSAPIEGFIVAAEEKRGVDAVVAEVKTPTLQEVVNDPYGSTSSAYVDTGVKFTAHQNLRLSVTAGVTINVSNGESGQFVSGVSAGIGPFVGQVNSVSTIHSFNIPISTGAHATWSYDYTYSLNDRVSTSSATSMVGAKADVYIGQVLRNYVARADAVTLIDSAMYALKQPAFQSGQMLLLAQSKIEGKPYYLVRGESLVFGAKPEEANFAYTQDHILKVVIPELERQRDNLILMNVDSTTAISLANQQRKSVYVSTVDVDDPTFGMAYCKYDPTLDNTICDKTDKVAQFNQQIAKWQSFIYENEKRKLTIQQKGEKMGNYSIVANANRTFSESVSHAGYWSGIVFDGITVGLDYSAFTPKTGKTENGDRKATIDDTPFANQNVQDNENNVAAISLTVFGITNKITLTPKVSPNFSRDANTTDSDTKGAGFTLSMNNEGYEDIAVYRLTDNSFNDEAKWDRNNADGGSLTSSEAEDNGYLYANYVFVREGGATRCPYEAEEKTLFYKPGTTLAPATMKIDDPHLDLSTRIVDNVPADQDVSIVVTLSNQSTYNPTVISSDFLLYVDDDSNPDGLQFFIDGSPLGDGRSFLLAPGASTQKTLVIRRGTAYDYNDIKLVLQHGCQRPNSTSTTFSVHYEPVSCPVALALPVQNWLMNTLSPADRNGYYIPVEISDFNTQYDNFDHLELQYKLAVESDDRYVTLCSYYADTTLMKQASGEKQMIDGATIRTSFYGERDPMEQEYDLRVVSFCRLGTSFVTRSSEVKHGTKDTRVPQLFGTATPANGILRVGDYISIPFSEAIAANYLDEDNNFQITGYTNSSVITGTTSLHFDANPTAYAATELTRNLTGKDITFDLMVLPDEQGRSMTYIMHGCDNEVIAFGQEYLGKDANNRDRICLELEMDLGDKFYYANSDTLPISNNWMRVAAVYHHETGKVDFYCGTEKLGYRNNMYSLPKGYSCTGGIYLGNHPDFDDMEGYRFSGRMLEVRLWNKALSPAEIQSTNMRYLTGYEQGLLAYYPLNEGRNEEYAEDMASGARMYLHGINWATPEGKAMHLNGNRLLLNGNHFASTNVNDYSLSMWFREAEEMVAGEGTNLFRSGNFCITLHPDRIHLQSNQFGTDGMGEYMDGGWHQLALSVNRALGTSALYVDGRSVAQFSSSLIGAPSASVAEVGPMKGSVDEMTFWETALPENYITSFYGHTPNDEEMALVTHLSFSQRKENNSGIYETKYNPYNCRIKRNREGHIIARSEDDRVVVTPDEDAEAWLTDGNAPVNEKAELTKMAFNWIGRDNELVINLTMLDKEINKQNVFITVRDVEDLHGNPMSSPLTWTLFVDRNQLRWSKPYIQETVQQGEERVVSIDIINEGGTTGNYQISGLPWWLTADIATGALSPLEQTPIQLTISDQLNPGEYDDMIYLTDGSGLSEPLRIRLTIEALQPGWEVDRTQVGRESMGLFAQVQIDGTRGRIYYASDPRDIVAAFIDNVCIGKQNIQMIGQQSLVVMNLYGDASFNKKTINFRYWQAATGNVYSLHSEDGDVIYSQMTVVGTPERPILLKSSELLTQQIPLEAGWNWISLYVDPLRQGSNFAADLDGQFKFTTGDIVSNKDRFMTYSKPIGEPAYWSGWALKMYPDSVYFVKVAKSGHLGVIGSALPDSMLYVDLKHDWNYLPYKLSTIQDVTTALAGYADYVQSGDIVKSYNAFAMYSAATNAWIGSLTHLRPGEGYMLYRKGAEPVRMYYQTDASVQNAPVHREVATAPARYLYNLPMVLTVPGSKEGERLQVMVGAEVVAEAEADRQGRFWVLMNAEEGDELRFRYLTETEEKIVRQPVTYRSAMPAVGSADEPYLLQLSVEGADVYPSLFRDHITFAAVAEQGETVRMAVYDALGRCIWQHTAETDSEHFSYTLSGTSAYTPGVYVAEITIGQNTKQVKLIKE